MSVTGMVYLVSGHEGHDFGAGTFAVTVFDNEDAACTCAAENPEHRRMTGPHQVFNFWPGGEHAR
jgi:hypothetical protein